MDSLFNVRVFRILFTLATFAITAIPLGRVESALITFTKLSDFVAATAGRTTFTEDFESFGLGANVSSQPRLAFGAIPNGNLLQVTDGSPTFGANGLRTFGTKYLGSDAGEIISLNVGQSFTINFKSNASAIGFFFVSDSQLSSNDLIPNSGELGIRIGSTTVTIDKRDEVQLAGGANGPLDSNAYFVGIVDTANTGVLSTVTVFPNVPNAAGFGIDNITTAVTAVPEPSSMTFAVLAMAGAVVWRTRQKRNSQLV